MEHRLVVCCFSLVHPGRLMAGTYKSPMKGKENHLNQTSMRTCSTLIFRGVSTFKWKKKQPNNSDCGWRESCTTWQVWNPVYAGIYYISTHQSRVSFTNTLFAPKLEGPAGQILSVCFSIFFGNHLAVKGKDLIFPVFLPKKIPTFPGLVKTQCFHNPRHWFGRWPLCNTAKDGKTRDSRPVFGPVPGCVGWQTSAISANLLDSHCAFDGNKIYILPWK